MDYEQDVSVPINGTYPRLDFQLHLSGNRSNLQIPGAYNLAISLAPGRHKIADNAVMVTTIFMHEGMYVTFHRNLYQLMW